MEGIELIDGDWVPFRVLEPKLKPILAKGKEQNIAERIIAAVVGVYPPQITPFFCVE